MDSGVLHDNMCLHVAQPVVDLFSDCTWEVLRHPPYSTHLSPLDLDLFPKLKASLCGIRLGSLDEFLLEMIREICHLNKERLLHGSQKLSDHWQVFIERGGDYTEGL